jgi:hypothetical protein
MRELPVALQRVAAALVAVRQALQRHAAPADSRYQLKKNEPERVARAGRSILDPIEKLRSSLVQRLSVSADSREQLLCCWQPALSPIASRPWGNI